MKLYDELADWWPIMADPGEFREEASFFGRLLRQSSKPRPRTVLDLGAGTGNNAYHLKAHFAMTLVDMSPQMLAVNRAVNPECDHIQGDIRTLRLGKTFDAVFVHDAVCHMTTEADLRAVMETAFVHCRPGGVALFVPDEMRETFVPSTEHGGSDSKDRSLRYVQWTTDPDPRDTTIVVDFGILLRDEQGVVTVVHERQTHGLFARAEWLRLLRQTGFTASVVSHKRIRDLFLCRRPQRPRKGSRPNAASNGALRSYSVRRSRVHGRGLFARTPYTRGDLVGEYRGRVIDVAAEGDTSSALDPDPAYTLLFAIDDRLTIDAGVRGNSIRFMNHSCDPNCETSVDGDRVFVHARRRIRPGEELTYDYNLRPGDESPEAYACRCGSKVCRGTMIDRKLLRSKRAVHRPA